MVTVIKDGQVVASAKNLEVISRYARKHYIHELRQEGDTLIVVYSDGAKTVTKFADASVLTHWIAMKRKYSGW